MQRIARRALLAGGLALPAFGTAARSFAQIAPAPAVGLQPPPAAAPPPPPPARIRDDQVEPLLKMLADAPTHGLGPYPVAELKARIRGDEGARDELRRHCIAYAAAQHGQRVPLGKFDPNWGMKPQPFNALLDFDFAIAHDRVAPWIAAQPPPFARYRTLRDGLATYGALAGDRAWPLVPPGPDLGPGATGPRLRALRQRLAFEDASVAIAGKRAATYDASVAAAVKRFQTRHGLSPTGTVGAATLKALNVTPEARAQAIRLNMERWRWAPRDLPPDRLEVNIAATELDIFQGGERVDGMLAAAGRPKDQSPLLASEIHSIVFNPAWHVPKSIATKELFRKGNGYLRSHGFSYVKDNPGAPLIQKPGPHNALGRIKFDFPNSYGVYLHDTPAQAAFSRSSRDVSHGCVRLQHPKELAERLLSSNPAWSPEKIDGVLEGETTTRAMLAAPMPVFLFYWTAFPAGPQLAFRDDIYGWDAQLAGLLGG